MIHFTLRRTVVWLAAGVVVGGLIALGMAWRQPVRHQASISFAANRINAAPVSEYQYDGYYAIQAAELFSQTVVSWFSTPSVILEVYEAADIPASAESLGALTSRFSVKKHAAQNMVVTFHEDTRERAEKIAAAVTSTMQTRAAQLNQTSDRRALFEIVGGKPVIVEQSANKALSAGIGAMIGFLVVLAGISLLSYLQSLATRDARRD